ncbi:MAG: SAM hydroxide adenosyltransferase [bacterium]
MDEKTWQELGVKKGGVCAVQIMHDKKRVFAGDIPFVNSFGDVKIGTALLYLNSQLYLSIALNQGNFAEKYNVSSGPEWRVEVRKIK